MLVLTFNTGSNSLKFDLIDARPGQLWPSEARRRFWGAVEDLGEEAGVTLAGRGKRVQRIPDYNAAAEVAVAAVRETLGNEVRPELVAHRVVHGGDQFDRSTVIDEDVVSGIEHWSEMAPLHNPPAVAAIRAAGKALPDVPGVAVFDTSFHRTLPERAYTYALPYQIAQDLGIRRYGFHGISHKYQMLRYAELAGVPVEKTRVVTLHLESGSSAAAIVNGQSVDTSMGFTPLEGLVMGSRCGDLDPALVGYLARRRGGDLDAVERLLNKDSGLVGLSGFSGDTRVLARELDRPRARLALEVFSYRVLKYVGAYIAGMNGADAVIFSGGIGENTPFVRTAVCAGLGWFGLDLDEQLNSRHIEGDARLTLEGSRLHAWAIRPDEAVMLAHEAVSVI